MHVSDASDAKCFQFSGKDQHFQKCVLESLDRINETMGNLTAVMTSQMHAMGNFLAGAMHRIEYAMDRSASSLDIVMARLNQVRVLSCSCEHCNLWHVLTPTCSKDFRKRLPV